MITITHHSVCEHVSMQHRAPDLTKGHLDDVGVLVLTSWVGWPVGRSPKKEAACTPVSLAGSSNILWGGGQRLQAKWSSLDTKMPRRNGCFHLQGAHEDQYVTSCSTQSNKPRSGWKKAELLYILTNTHFLLVSVQNLFLFIYGLTQLHKSDVYSDLNYNYTQMKVGNLSAFCFLDGKKEEMS